MYNACAHVDAFVCAEAADQLQALFTLWQALYGVSYLTRTEIAVCSQMDKIFSRKFTKDIRWVLVRLLHRQRHSLIIKLNGLSLVTRTSIWEERTDCCKLSSDLHRCTVVWACPHTHISINVITFKGRYIDINILAHQSLETTEITMQCHQTTAKMAEIVKSWQACRITGPLPSFGGNKKKIMSNLECRLNI